MQNLQLETNPVDRTSFADIIKHDSNKLDFG